MSVAARVVMAVAIAILLPTEASAKWTRLRTANFLFIGDAPPGQIRQVAERLEQFREVMSRFLAGNTVVTPVPTTVLVFATDRALTPVKPLFRGNTIEVSGYFQSGEDVNYIALNGEYIDTALLTIFHEYAHVLVNNAIGRVPVWANEGLAEFYHVMTGLDGGKTVVIGRAPVWHVELLKASTLMPIKELLAVDHDSSVYNEGSRRGVFYAQSWALTHYLMFGNKERATQFNKYLAALKSGADANAAFSEAFGPDTTVLDRELFQYVRQFAFPALSLKFNEKISADAERGTTIDDIEGEVYLSDLQARIGREDEARTRLQSILKRKPDTARASTVLGLIDLRAKRFTDALPILERAAEQDPRDAFVQTSFGRGVVASLTEQRGEAKADAIKKARAALSQAVDIDATSAYAAGLLGYLELLDGNDLPRAVLMLERAARLAPSREWYRLTLAQTLIQQGELRRATTLLGPLLSAGSTADVRNDARRLLAVVGDRSQRPADGPVAGTTARTRNDLVSLSTASELTATPPPPTATVRLDLRIVQAGETRVLASFRAIECQREMIVLVMESDGKVMRFSAKQLSDIDFITYRSEPPGNVSCGPLPMPVRVLATYRARTAAAAATTGDGAAVAIELLPDGYSPPR